MKRSLALIVTYNPQPGFEQHLEQLFTEFVRLVVIDNGSSLATQKMLKKQAHFWKDALVVLLNSNNLGIAAALNLGFDWAISHGYDYVIALDQDSLPMPGMTRAMLHANDNHPNRDKIAIVAPVVEDPSAAILARFLRPKNFLFFERKYCNGQVLDNISIVITSGSMYNLKRFEQLGPFRDDFFIDYVDTEYCLRVKKQGFDIIVACDARLRHRLGNQKKFNIGSLQIRPTFHSVIRWYYISRNRVPMIREYGLHFPHWLLYELIVNGYGLLRMLFFEDHKLGKMLASVFGCFDGLIGRSGEIPADRRKLLSRFG
jgi:rhamnosyltransferase